MRPTCVRSSNGKHIVSYIQVGVHDHLMTCCIEAPQSRVNDLAILNNHNLRCLRHIRYGRTHGIARDIHSCSRCSWLNECYQRWGYNYLTYILNYSTIRSCTSRIRCSNRNIVYPLIQIRRESQLFVYGVIDKIGQRNTVHVHLNLLRSIYVQYRCLNRCCIFIHS